MAGTLTTNENQQPSRSEIFTKETINHLSSGFLVNCKPALENTKKQLTEVTEKQNALIQQLHDENLQLSAVQHSPDLHKIFNAIKIYQNKLVNIKKDMRSLHEKSTKLKKRALKLQQYKEKEAYIKQQHKDVRTKLEEELISKPSTSSNK